LKGRSGDDIFFIENPLGEISKGLVTLTKTHSRGFFNSPHLFQGYQRLAAKVVARAAK